MSSITGVDTNDEVVDATLAEQIQVNGGGTSDHRDLTHRDAEDQHPISAITGLQTELDSKLTGIPLADEDTVGGVKANAADQYDTMAVRIKEDGTLATKNRVFIAQYGETEFSDIVPAAIDRGKKVVCWKFADDDYTIEFYELTFIDDAQTADPHYAYFTSRLEENTVKWVKATKSGNSTVWTSGTVVMAAKAYVDIRAGITTETITLAANGWGAAPNVAQTVTIHGMTMTAIVWLSPANQVAAIGWGEAQIFCTAQGVDSLTFRCMGDAPAADVAVNVAWKEP